MKTSDERLEQTAKKLFDESVDGLDAASKHITDRGKLAEEKVGGSCKNAGPSRSACCN